VSAPRRAAVLGQGSIGRRHAGLLRDAGLDVVTFDPLDPSGAASEEAALDGADVALVCTPSSEHARHARLALEAGVPVLVEKPLALDAGDARRLEALSDTTGVPLGVAMNLRFHPGVRVVRELLPQAGRVWRASAWCGSYLPAWRPGTDYRRSYSAQRALGGGVLLDAIHEIDYVTWLLGPATSVQATLRHVSDLELDVEDVALLTLEHAGGALSTVELDYVDRDYHRGCRVVGAGGTIAWDWTAGEVRLTPADAAPITLPAPPDAGPTYAAEQRAFLEAVATGSPPPVTAAEGRHALEVVDAARASAAADGARIRLSG
jgi:predicted dehydrogenase